MISPIRCRMPFRPAIRISRCSPWDLFPKSNYECETSPGGCDRRHRLRQECRVPDVCPAGVPVYDSDREAKRLMNADEELKAALVARFGASCYVGGVLDRRYLAGVVFGDGGALADLNGLVHPVVRRDFCRWADRSRHLMCWSRVPYCSRAGSTGMWIASWPFRLPRSCASGGPPCGTVPRRS